MPPVQHLDPERELRVYLLTYVITLEPGWVQNGNGIAGFSRGEASVKKRMGVFIPYSNIRFAEQDAAFEATQPAE